MRSLQKPGHFRHFRHFALAAAVVASFVLGGTVTASNLGPATPGQVHVADALGPVELPAGVTANAVPARVFDSRLAVFGGTRIVRAVPRTINVRDAINGTTGAVTQANAIPAGATAITYNLTVTGTVGAGFLSIIPGTGVTTSSSSINWARPA